MCAGIMRHVRGACSQAPQSSRVCDRCVVMQSAFSETEGFVNLCNSQNMLCKFEIAKAQFANILPEPDHIPYPNPNVDPNANQIMQCILPMVDDIHLAHA